jgi:hypothetical protein
MLQSIHREGYRAPDIRRVYIPKPGKTEKGVARQSGWEDSDNQDGHFGGRGMRMIVAAQR